MKRLPVITLVFTLLAGLSMAASDPQLVDQNFALPDLVSIFVAHPSGSQQKSLP